MVICILLGLCGALWLAIKLTGAVLSGCLWLFIEMPLGLIFILTGIALCCTILLIPVGNRLITSGVQLIKPFK